MKLNPITVYLWAITRQGEPPFRIRWVNPLRVYRRWRCLTIELVPPVQVWESSMVYVDFCKAHGLNWDDFDDIPF